MSGASSATAVGVRSRHKDDGMVGAVSKDYDRDGCTIYDIYLHSSKFQKLAKSKLCALPVEQSIGSEASIGCLKEQSKIDGHHTQNIRSNS